MKSPCRQAVTDALDDLGERDRLSYAERSSWEEPYPPSFVEERLEALRRDQWWTKRCVFGLLGVAAGLMWVGPIVGLPLSTFAYLIPMLIIPQFPTIYMLIRNGKAEALYALLRDLDEPSGEPVEPSLAEVA